MKKYLFIVVFAMFLFIPKSVFARVSRVMTLPSDYNQVLTNVTISEGNNSVDYTGWTNSTAYIRLYSDDTLEPSKTYVSSFGFCVFTWDKDNTAIFGNSIGGWNVSGGYVSTSPVVSNVVDYNSTIINGRIRYQRCYSQSWEFTTPSTISTPFFQIGLDPNNQTLVKFTWWNWSIIQKDSSASDITNSISNNTNTIINNYNENTQNIINNQNQNALDIINNQNQIAQQQEENQKVCSSIIINKSDIISSGNLNNSGVVVAVSSSDPRGVTDFIDITNVKNLKNIVSSGHTTYQNNLCFYDSNKSYISCLGSGSYNDSSNIPVPSNAKFVRFTIWSDTNSPQFELYSCKNGNQALNDTLNQEFDTGIGANLFGDVDWYENSYFSSIITSPIVFLNSLNDTCTPITLPLFNKNIVLPCGTTIFWDLDNSYVRTFRAFWCLLFGGIIIYRLALKLIMNVNNAIDPTKDDIGGLEL